MNVYIVTELVENKSVMTVVGAMNRNEALSNARLGLHVIRTEVIDHGDDMVMPYPPNVWLWSTD